MQSSDNKEIHALAAPDAGVTAPAIQERISLQPSYSYEQEIEERSVPLSHYLWILRRRKWRILSFILFSVISTLLVSSRLTPIYESTASLDVDRQAPAAVIGQDAARLAPNDADQFLATQVKIIQSDSVLRPVAERYKLPVLDAASLPGADAAPLPSTRMHEAPVTLKNLKVTRPPNTYLLLLAYRSPDP